jgi:hypothetical protein
VSQAFRAPLIYRENASPRRFITENRVEQTRLGIPLLGFDKIMDTKPLVLFL